MSYVATKAVLRAALCVSLLALASGCRSDQMATGSVGTPPPPRSSAPPPEMAGRWMLSSGAGVSCAVNFSGAPGAPEGAIRPEGGCPGNFFTSRKWTFENGGIVIRNHNNEPLAQLTGAAPGRFDGQSTAGQSVSLTR